MTEPVPAELVGVWRRRSLVTPDGRDETTQVVWVQTESWYADLRIPAGPLVRTDVRRLEDCNAVELVALAQIQGFAGQLSVDGGVCSWRRDLDFQPPGPTPDEGNWEIEGPVMIERGLHAEYEEVWVRDADVRGPLEAFRRTGGRRGLMVVAGDHFLAVLDRPHPLPGGESLAAIVAAELAAGDRAAALARLDMPICYGLVRGGGSPWEVRLSSWPWLEGQGLAPPSGDGWTHIEDAKD